MPESALTPVETPQDVLDFWFREVDKSDWFRGGAELDAKIAARFADLHGRLSDEVPDSWLASHEGVLAAIIVLDQFSRNLFRGDARAFASDGDALNLAHLAIERVWDGDYPDDERQFLYMPFMHVEDTRGQDRSVELFGLLDDDEPLRFADKHRDVIARFGRFPGRNTALGRESTAAEQRYLDDGGGF
ncbi:MAG: DUF924 family protein [Pacificimonas sp.]